jgi:flagellar assembly protein FliH
MATVIRKQDSSVRSAGRTVRPVAFDFENLNDRANEYLDTVRCESAKIVQQAHQQAEQIRRQAEVDGRQAAEDAAQKVLDERVGLRMNTLLPALESLIAQLNDAKADWLRRWEQSAVAVAAAIAERIIRRELDRQPEIALEWIAEALRLAAGSASIKLHLNPTDHEHLGSQVQRLAESLCQLAAADVVADPAVSPGGCRVETQFGEIDQQIEAQLARIQAELNST